MFIKRLSSTVVLLGLFGNAVFAPYPWNRFIFLLLSALLTFGLVREICAIAGNLGMDAFRNFTAFVCLLTVLLFNLLYIFSSNLFGFHIFPVLCIILFMLFWVVSLGIPLFILFSGRSEEKIRKLFNSLGIAVFVLIPVLFILGIYVVGESHKLGKLQFNYYFLIFILLTKIGDIGAYVIGTVSNKLMKGGNHKMIPSISPGKSWEGAAGGLIVTVLLAAGFHYWLPEAIVVRSLPLAIITGVCMFFGSMAGDLMESALKRAAKVKDSGATIPGIGGVFDLVDSLFVTAPVAVFIYILCFYAIEILLFFD